MIDLGPDAMLRVGCIIVAVVGLMVLVLSMVRFDQHRRGRIAALVIGAVLVLASIGVVMWTSWTV